MAAAFSTAIISSERAGQPRDGLPVDERLRVVGRQVPGEHGEVVGHAAVRDGDAGEGGYGDRAGQPGDHRDRYAGLAARDHLLEAAPEDEAVAALEAHHPLARERPRHDQVVDGLLGGGPPARDLGHVDELGRRRQLAEQVARGEPVGDHHVGLHQRLAAGHRHQLRVAGTAADEHHAGRAVAVVRRGDGALTQPLEDLVADGRGAPRVAVAQPMLRTRRSRPRMRPTAGVQAEAADGVVGPHAEDPPCLGRRAHRLVGRRGRRSRRRRTRSRRGRRPRSRAAPSAISPASASASMAGVASGETTVTTAPDASSAGTRRWATCPAPTITTRRPASRSPEGYGG